MKFINILPVTDETCHLVSHLELQPNSNHNVADDDLADILPDCPSLETVIFTGVPDLSDRTLVLLASNAIALKVVDISGCQQVTNIGITALDAHARTLEVLRLNRVSLLTDPAISAVVLSLSHLTELELCDLPLITVISIRDIWPYCKRLRRLRLARCQQLTNKGFPYAFAPSPVKEKRPRRSGISLASRSPSTNARDAFEGSSFSFERPLTWLEALPPLILPITHTLEELRSVDLTSCYQLNDDAVLGLVTHAPRIHNISLAGCVDLTDASLRSLAKLGDHLDTVALAHVDNITDRGISILCGSCKRLRSINVSYCDRLTDLSIIEISSLLEMASLSATNIPSVTDNAILFLAEHTPHLAELHLSHCPQISLEAMHTLISKLVQLQHLSASGIPSLSRKGVERFSEPVPSGHEKHIQGLFRVFRGNSIDELRFFLNKEVERQREAEKMNVLFLPRADSKMDLY